jgi:hypothetical protein
MTSPAPPALKQRRELHKLQRVSQTLLGDQQNLSARERETVPVL